VRLVAGIPVHPLDALGHAVLPHNAVGTGRRRSSRPVPTAGSKLGLEDVLDLLACILDVAFGLVGVTFGFQILVVGGLPGLLLGLPLDLFGLVLRLVDETLVRLLS